MSAKKVWAFLGALAIAGAGLYATGCSSDDSNAGNPTPTAHDASTQGDSSTTGDGGTGDGGNPSDSGNPNCQSDAAHCNSCVTPSQDPLNACAPSTANCRPFDNSRVPKNVPSP